MGGTAFFRVFADGVFLAAGPARTAKGYLREDIYDLPNGTGEVVIEAVGYYCKSIATVWQPSYVMAEIRCQDQVLAYTGKDFSCFEPGCKVQKTERYSVQRHFTEIWDYREVSSLKAPMQIVDVCPHILERKAPYPEYREVNLTQASFVGVLEYDEERSYKPVRYSWDHVPKEWGIF